MKKNGSNEIAASVQDDKSEKHRVYTLEEIQEKVVLFAEEFDIQEVYLFGSYARGEADEKSDLDFVVKLSEERDYGMEYFSMGEVAKEIFGIAVDVIDMDAFASPRTYTARGVKENFEKEKILIYKRSRM